MTNDEIVELWRISAQARSDLDKYLPELATASLEQKKAAERLANERYKFFQVVDIAVKYSVKHALASARLCQRCVKRSMDIVDSKESK